MVSGGESLLKVDYVEVSELLFKFNDYYLLIRRAFKAPEAQ